MTTSSDYKAHTMSDFYRVAAALGLSQDDAHDRYIAVAHQNLTLDAAAVCLRVLTELVPQT